MFLDNIMIALTALKSNKLRSFLTMLGIVIGIASVIAIMIVGDAVNNSVMDSFNNMGANTITFYLTEKEFEDENDYVYRTTKSTDMISEEMITDINEHFADRVDKIVLTASMGQASVSERNKSTSVQLSGVNAAALSSKDLTMLEGRTLSAKDFSNSAKTALISDKAAKKLYGNNYKNVVGKPIEAMVGNKMHTFTVVGVYEYKKDSSIYSSSDSSNTSLYIPLRTAFCLDNSDISFGMFEIQAATGEDQTKLTNDIKDYLNVHYYKNNDLYNIDGFSLQSYIDESKDAIGKIKLAIAAIAAISLLVGGIGVMNIMIVSITERTREIGTRKALGAENGSIRMQFITEAIVICVIGGGIGILLGKGLGSLASHLLHISGSVSPLYVAGCVLFSMVFGVFFGYYPANKAAKLNPIDALRYE
jgi:putative ABC transport system permease protein